MKPVTLLGILLIAACANAAEERQPGSAQITHIFAEGNLQSRNDLGCIKVEVLQNIYTAADLYRSNAECVKLDDLDSAVYSSALAGVYARYDSMRVSDQSAHQAQDVLSLNLAEALTEDERTAFMAKMSAVAGDSVSLATLCRRIRAVGPPNYHPTYMIQHGMGAFTGAGGNGLVSDFDGAVAWEEVLDTYLHCPKL